MNSEERDRLYYNRESLIKYIDPEVVLAKLLERKILTIEDYQEILNAGNESKQVDKLIDVLVFRGSNAYSGFREVLIECNKRLVNELDQTPLKELEPLPEKSSSFIENSCIQIRSNNVMSNIPSGREIAKEIRRSVSGIGNIQFGIPAGGLKSTVIRTRRYSPLGNRHGVSTFKGNVHQNVTGIGNVVLGVPFEEEIQTTIRNAGRGETTQTILKRTSISSPNETSARNISSNVQPTGYIGMNAASTSNNSQVKPKPQSTTTSYTSQVKSKSQSTTTSYTSQAKYEVQTSVTEKQLTHEQRSKKLTLTDINRIAGLLNCPEWRSVGKWLDFTDEELQQFTQGVKSNDFQECALHMLIKWKDKKKDACTFGKIYKALKAENMDEIVEKLLKMTHFI